MKRILAMLLTVVLMLGLALPVFADNGENGYNGYNDENGYYNGYYENNGEDELNGYVPPQVTPARPTAALPAGSMIGYVGEVSQDRVEILDGYGEVQLVVLLVAGNYAVIDAVTGFAAELDDHDGGQVLVVYGPIVAQSLPPQSNALVIAINVDGVEYNKLPHHHVIEAIEWDEEALVVTVDNGGLLVTLNEDTDLQAWLTRQVVILDEFRVGDEVLLWYSVVGLSYPAQTTATRALRLVPAQYVADEDPVDNGYDVEPTIDENGFVKTGESIVRAGVELWPVRVNAVAAGYTVVWNVELWRAELTVNGVEVVLIPGSAIIYVNGEAYPMSAPTLLEGGTLFAPADFFDKL